MSIENQESQNLSFTVDSAQAGQRLDVFLSQADPAFSRSQIKYAVEEGNVTVNGREPKASQHLKAGDRVELHLEPAVEAAAAPQDIP
ncbi:MAG: S4 domain-containing protein, partial [Smithellaceae bacterium]|nr:S4 domain-containing protein [Smithellaceae bacterium]